MSYTSIIESAKSTIASIEGVADIYTWDNPNPQDYPFCVVKPEVNNAGASEPDTNHHRRQVRRIKVSIIDEQQTEDDGEYVERRFVDLIGRVEDELDKMNMTEQGYKIFIRESTIIGFTAINESTQARLAEITLRFERRYRVRGA